MIMVGKGEERVRVGSNLNILCTCVKSKDSTETMLCI